MDTGTPRPSSTPAMAIVRDAAALAADRAAYRRVVSAGFGLWLDYDWRKKGWDTREPEKNYFSPAGFETALRAALEQSDEYVWIYTETPRWWSAKGTIRRPAAGLRRRGPARPHGPGRRLIAARAVHDLGAMLRRFTRTAEAGRMS